jgi:hypothetical protein
MYRSLIVQYSRKQCKDDEEAIVTVSTERQSEVRSRIFQNSHGGLWKRYVSITVLLSSSHGHHHHHLLTVDWTGQLKCHSWQ